MRAVIALYAFFALVMGLAACGKKEEYIKAMEPQCHGVEILHVEGNVTLMEVEGEPPRLRMSREGHFGKVGDRFKFCERT